MKRLPWETARLLCVPLLLLGLAGCAAHAEVYSLGHPPPAHVKVPPGHMPPPGQCRIWFPDRPPGHQPPPGSCHELRYHVPPGGYLIRG